MDNLFNRRSFLQKSITLAGAAGACLLPSEAKSAPSDRQHLLKIPSIDTHA
ncbi:twin-arginine translocation signal domain-containing protein, partial [bacterium]|nr:twin-arginine translocation signal domain-containing protein [bacterium]